MSAVAHQELFLGECPLHGWHGKTVCVRCREAGSVALFVKTLSGGLRTIYVSESLLRFRGGGREKVRQEARCRMCLRPRGPDTRAEAISKDFPPGVRALTRHHIVPQSWFKGQPPATRAIRSVDANVVPLCRQCHDEVEGDEEGCRMLRRVLGTEEITFVLQTAGHPWLDRRYPK